MEVRRSPQESQGGLVDLKLYNKVDFKVKTDGGRKYKLLEIV